MRSISLQPWAVVGAGLWWLPSLGMAQDPPPPPPPAQAPPGATAPAAGGLKRIEAERALLNSKPLAEAGPEELAGLPKGHHAERLDWGRAYRLALVRSRAQGDDPAPAEAIDPNVLEDAAKRLGVDGFEAFRKASLDDPKFRDPAAPMLDLIARQQRFANARHRLDAFQRLLDVMKVLLQAENSMQTQLQADRVEDALQDARLRLVQERDGYREALDRLKVELGLSPHAAVVLDPSLGSGFRAGFDALTQWSARPNRTLAELPAIVSRMPALPDVAVGGTSVAALVENPDAIESALRSMAAEARKTRGKDVDLEAELRMRRDLRRLVESNLQYQILKRKLILLVRLKDQVFEEIIAPPEVVATTSTQPGDRVTSLLAAEGDLRRAGEALTGHWATYQTLRLSLARDLGSLPAKSWEDLYGTLSAPAGK